MSNVFALVDDNLNIVSYGLTKDDINAINKPTNNYCPCYYDNQPNYQVETQKLVESPIYINQSVLIRYVPTDISVTEAIGEVNSFLADRIAAGLSSGFSDIPQDIVTRTIAVIKRDVQSLLDQFAMTRGYDDIKSACSYYGSTNQQFSTEASRCMELRDNTWNGLYIYLAYIQENGFPSDFSWDSVLANLPELTW